MGESAGLPFRGKRGSVGEREKWVSVQNFT